MLGLLGNGTKGLLGCVCNFALPRETFGRGCCYQQRPKGIWSRFVAGTGTNGSLRVDLCGFAPNFFTFAFSSLSLPRRVALVVTLCPAPTCPARRPSPPPSAPVAISSSVHPAPPRTSSSSTVARRARPPPPLRAPPRCNAAPLPPPSTSSSAVDRRTAR